MLYSIVVPVYRSNTTLMPLADRVAAVFQEIKEAYEIVFVEDCGGGNSWEVLRTIKEKYKDKITIIKLSKNVGQHNAIMCGFNHVKGDYVVTIDDDLQCPPEEIKKLIVEAKNTNAELVYGIYVNKKHHVIRNYASNWVKYIFKIVFDAKPDGSSFRLLKRTLVDKLLRHTQPFVFIDGLLHWHTKQISYCVVEHLERQHGSSTYTISKLINLTSNLIFNFTVLPLRGITYIGTLTSLVSFFIGFYFIYNKFVHDVPIGYTSLVVTILFSTGLILISLGIIGEYLSRIYMLQNNKPQYSIEVIE